MPRAPKQTLRSPKGRALNAALDALRTVHPAEYAAYRAVEIEGKTQREAAAELGISQMEVSRRRNEAIVHLERMWLYHAADLVIPAPAERAHRILYEHLAFFTDTEITEIRQAVGAMAARIGEAAHCRKAAMVELREVWLHEAQQLALPPSRASAIWLSDPDSDAPRPSRDDIIARFGITQSDEAVADFAALETLYQKDAAMEREVQRVREWQRQILYELLWFFADSEVDDIQERIRGYHYLKEEERAGRFNFWEKATEMASHPEG